MSISLNIEVNDHNVQNLLADTQRRLQNMSPAFKNIGEYMIRQREELFRDEKAPDGTPWTPLAQSTLNSIFRKKKRSKKAALRSVTNKKILTQDHHLRRTVYRAASDHVVVGPDKTSQAYAAIHQFGGKAGRGRKVLIPARPHLGVNDEDKKEFIEIIREHLISGVV